MKDNKSRRFLIYPVLVFVVLIGIVIGVLFKETTETSEPDEVAEAFINIYWDKGKKYFYYNDLHTRDSNHHPGPDNGLYTDFWWEAQLAETIMDVYEFNHDTKYIKMIDDVFEGFLDTYPNWQDNPFNDDIGWWSLAACRAYELTDDEKYFDLAKEMFDFIYPAEWSEDLNGGLWWNRHNFMPQKNVCTNGTFGRIALKLYAYTNDTYYKDSAERIYSWLTDHFYDEKTGKVGDNITSEGTKRDWEFTYNFGTYAAFSYAMFEVKHDSIYKERAIQSLDWVIEHLANDNILPFEGFDDANAFKIIYARSLKEIGIKEKREDYINIINLNAQRAYQNRNDKNLIGADWNMVSTEKFIQSSAAGAGVAIIHLSEKDSWK